MGFPKGASIPFGQVRGQYPGREVDSFIVVSVDIAFHERNDGIVRDVNMLGGFAPSETLRSHTINRTSAAATVPTTAPP